MVNGRSLEEELKRINDFFATLSIEEFEEMAFDCGVGMITASNMRPYIEGPSKQYKNEGSHKKDIVFDTTPEDVEAA